MLMHDDDVQSDELGDGAGLYDGWFDDEYDTYAEWLDDEDDVPEWPLNHMVG